ncbi:hypothetical protein [Leptolyngbya sp. BC1307]|uniref:hypothetical protein n=1 Tax=Leptolyngbya sp. BC1307 TaxID=2029589 RepID=UPI000EFCF799|nr:hypothetical protein [Leptolyngbya sp. BC1307]
MAKAIAAQFLGESAYSFVFDGQLGTSDYALANPLYYALRSLAQPSGILMRMNPMSLTKIWISLEKQLSWTVKAPSEPPITIRY